ncbi:TPA: hypothetical protein N0F65_010818 [Lagenidium giganteum]|uniref:BZIP domain-containing protein n=1 Tax=Lagenidium giganteum TaxID=4803 RepID=A0AAV2Z1L5_9STRA|nr:TPA: hypothetical protein N0F65_010818 [Lagenidium giganteum]
MAQDSDSLDDATGSPVTTEEDRELLQRRIQFRLYQRKHRAKIKEKTATLEKHVETLLYDVVNLQIRRQALVDEQAVVSSDVMAPTRVVRTFFELFTAGYSPRHGPQQFDFLHAVMDADVR